MCEGHYWAFFGESWSGGALAKLEDVEGMRPPATPASDQDPARTPSLTQVESTAPLCSLPEVMRVPLDSLLLQVLALSPTMVGQEGPVAFMQVSGCVLRAPPPPPLYLTLTPPTLNHIVILTGSGFTPLNSTSLRQFGSPGSNGGRARCSPL